MFIVKYKSKALKFLASTSQNPIFSLINPKNHLHNYTQTQNYVNVYMKWKKDPYYDSIEHIHKSIELKSIISLKNLIAKNPNGCIPISDISKKGLHFDVKIKVARFLRQYSSIFEEFVGPKYNLPWFGLTQEAAEIDKEEKRVFEESKDDLRERLKKFILMSKEKVLPFKIIQGMLWYLGLPDDFLQYQDGFFRVVKLNDNDDDGLMGLGVENNEMALSVMQKNAMKRGVYSGKSMEKIEFPLFPSKGLRLRSKIKNWLENFQELPYISPYEDYSNLDPNSEIAEKRLVGFFHELLSLFVDNSAERKKLLCLKKYFGLSQKMHKVFERHPHMFYLSFRNKTCTVILKEGYGYGEEDDEVGIGRHPMLMVRQKYVKLMKKSQVILKRRRVKSPFFEHGKLDFDCVHEDNREI